MYRDSYKSNKRNRRKKKEKMCEPPKNTSEMKYHRCAKIERRRSAEERQWRVKKGKPLSQNQKLLARKLASTIEKYHDLDQNKKRHRGNGKIWQIKAQGHRQRRDKDPEDSARKWGEKKYAKKKKNHAMIQKQEKKHNYWQFVGNLSVERKKITYYAILVEIFQDSKKNYCIEVRDALYSVTGTLFCYKTIKV